MNKTANSPRRRRLFGMPTDGGESLVQANIYDLDSYSVELYCLLAIWDSQL